MADLSVSVVIPTYNRAHLLARAVRSVLANIRKDDEILIADDGSQDDTAKVASSFGAPVRFLPGPHRGAGATRNRGVQAATRPLLAFLDSDDEWFPTKLTLQRHFLARRPDVLFCFSNFAARDAENIEPHYLVQWHKDSRPWDEILGPGTDYSTIADLPAGHKDFRVHVGSLFLAEMLSDYVATSTLMVRREEAGNALLFAEDLKVSEDKECFARLAQRGPAAYFDCDLSYQWGHSGPRITDDNNAYELATSRIAIMQRIWANDAEFMRKHGEAYATKLEQQHLIQARWHLTRGQTAQARQALRKSGHSPWHYRLLASLPGQLTRQLLGLRRAFKLAS